MSKRAQVITFLWACVAATLLAFGIAINVMLYHPDHEIAGQINFACGVLGLYTIYLNVRTLHRMKQDQTNPGP